MASRAPKPIAALLPLLLISAVWAEEPLPYNPEADPPAAMDQPYNPEADPLPPDEPPGDRSASQGLRTGPK